MNYYAKNRRSVAMVILLSLITCGIYHFFWIYSTTKALALFNEDYKTSPGLVIVFSFITCGIYSLYWWYKIGGMFVESQMRAKVNPIVDNKLLMLFLSIFGLGILSTAILQSDLNLFWEKLDDNNLDGYSTGMDF